MKRVRINAGTAGLVFKKGDYKRVLTKGTYWLGWRENIVIYDLGTYIQNLVSVEKVIIWIKSNENKVIYNETRIHWNPKDNN